LIGKKVLRVLCVKAATARAFRYFLDPCTQELAHFECDDPRKVPSPARAVSSGHHPLCALSEGVRRCCSKAYATLASFFRSELDEGIKLLQSFVVAGLIDAITSAIVKLVESLFR
jgi:hypothetical protein